jgi:hypothetical protein
VAVLLTTGGVAAADDGDAEVAAPKRDWATISFSPLHLALPMLEAEAEVQATPHVGAGLILGGGRATDSSKTVTGTAYEAGLQLNWYAFAPFSGAHLGLEGMYLRLSDVMDDPFAHASGLSVGAYVGYKLQTGAGFALVAQLGVQYVAATGATSTRTIGDSDVAPLLNLNAGWSF